MAGHGMSERQACRVIGCCRMTMRYAVVRQDDPVLRERLKDLAKARRRFGYRRLHVLLRREGHEVNHKRLSAFTAKNNCMCAVAVDASVPWAHEPR